MRTARAVVGGPSPARPSPARPSPGSLRLATLSQVWERGCDPAAPVIPSTAVVQARVGNQGIRIRPVALRATVCRGHEKPPAPARDASPLPDLGEGGEPKRAG